MGNEYGMHHAPVDIAGSDFIIDGDRRFCSHARVYSSPVDSAPAFIHFANPIVVRDGSRFDGANCWNELNSNARPIDELLPGVVDSLLQLQAAVPEPINKHRLQVCTQLNYIQLLDAVKVQGVAAFFVLDDLNKNQQRQEQSSITTLVDACGFFSCGPSTSNMQVQFYQLNTTRWARMDFIMTGVYPNDTYIGLYNLTSGQLVTGGCAQPVADGNTVQLLNVNFWNHTSYVLGVAWAPPGRTSVMTIRIVYRGDPLYPYLGGASSIVPSSGLFALFTIISLILSRFV